LLAWRRLRVTRRLLPLLRLLLLPRLALQAENLFVRRQVGLYREREVKPTRATPWTKLLLIVLSQLFDRRRALVIVKPETFLRWHRAGFQLFWRWQSRRRGRPPLPRDLGQLIRQMSQDNPTWGQKRIADEFLLKLGVRLSPRFP
jgi:putative transposase